MPTKQAKDKNSKAGNDLKIVKEITKTLLALLEIKKAKTEIKKDKEGIIYINVNKANLEELTGSLKETIFSLQLILSLMVYRKLGRWQKIVVDLDGWRKKREEELKTLALNSAQKVKFSGQEISLSQLNSAERRIIHLTLADSKDVYTESKGEGEQRILLIKPKVND